MKKEKITIAGIELTKENRPNLFQMAQRNPEGLEEQLRGLDKAQRRGGADGGLRGEENLNMAASLLEHDLQHDS